MSLKNKEQIWSFVDMSSAKLALSEVDTDAMGPDDRVTVRIPMFRTGKFEHPMYGKLDFTQEYLNKLKDNYDRGVLGRALPIDEDHRRFTSRAVGWIESEGEGIQLGEAMIQNSDGSNDVRTVLYGEVTLNRRGAQLVKEGEYRYFSAEISNDYTTRELNSSGDKGSMVKHGPVLVGGALTNNPFIPGLGGYQYSDGYVETEGDESRLVVNSEFDDDLGFRFGVYGYGVSEAAKENDNGEVETLVVDEEDVALSGDATTGEGMKNLLEKLAQFGTAPEKIAFLRNESASYSDGSPERAAVEVMLSTLVKAEEMDLALSEAVRVSAQREAEVLSLKESNARLALEALEARELAFTEQVSLFAERHISDGHYPAVVNMIKDIALSSPVTSREAVFALSNDAETKVDLLKVCEKILAALPKEARLSFASDLETTVEVKPEADTTEASKDDLPEKVQIFAAEFGWTPGEDMWPSIAEDGRGFNYAG